MQRYNMNASNGCVVENESAVGIWVKYEDVNQKVAKLKAAISQWESSSAEEWLCSLAYKSNCYAFAPTISAAICKCIIQLIESEASHE